MIRMRNFGIAKRLALLVGIATAGILCLCAIFLTSERTLILQERQLGVQQSVEIAMSVFQHYYKAAEKGEIPEADARQRALEVIRALRYGNNEYFSIYDLRGRVLMHPITASLEGKDLIEIKDVMGKQFMAEFVEVVKTRGAGFVSYHWPRAGSDRPIPKIAYVKNFEPWGWIISTGAYTDSVEETFIERLMKLSLWSLALVVILGVICMLIARSITRPLKRAVAIAQTVAAGDLTSEIEVKTHDETGQLLLALKVMNDSLKGIVNRVNTGAHNIAIASQQITAGNADLASRTENQASSLQQTAAAMEELTVTVAQNAENAQQANQLAHSAWKVAQKGGEVVSQVVQTMNSINDSAHRIAEITGVIDAIAFQTNLLALNAAVEAARAGSNGRGFAVVAAEVRNLAQRAAFAAKEIKELINESASKVGNGTKLVDVAGTTMDEIVANVRQVADIMSEIRAASEEQRSGIEQVNFAVAQMDQVTQSNAALVEESFAAAQSMQDQANVLTHATNVFKLGHVTERDPVQATQHKTPRPAVEQNVVPLLRKQASTGEHEQTRYKHKRIANGSLVPVEPWEEF